MLRRCVETRRIMWLPVLHALALLAAVVLLAPPDN
jgi:hypothetical protein